MSEIRDFVNIPWKHYMLRQDKAQFHQLVSALDTVEDAEEAIRAFHTDEVGQSKGTLYLIIYGLLQAFFVQQDATRHLCEALGIQTTISNYPQLEAIREIRNDSIGHPTKRDRPKQRPTSYHQISRITMSKNGFTLLSNYSNGTSQFRDISIPDLIAEQNKFIVEILELAVKELQAEVKRHKESFRMEKLFQIFPDTLGYAFEKIGGGLYSDPVQIAHWGIEHVKTTLEKFHNAIQRRDMDAYIRLEDDLKYINRAIEQLEKILDARANHTNQPEDEYDGYIYLSFLRDQVYGLRDYAREIDSEYEAE